MRFSKSPFLKSFCDDKGQVLVMTVFCMAVLIGMLGLAVDVGVLFHARRQMQSVADAAAMAGATEMFYNGATNVDTRAKAAAKANGVDSAISGNAVIVATSPTLAGGVACPTCVKVQVAKPNPTIFMQTMSNLFFGNHNYSSVNVSAAAVAGAPGSSQTCMYVMDPTGSSSLWIHGAGKINAPGCSVYVNSNDPGALCVTGSAGKSIISNIAVVGGQDGGGPCKGDPGAPVNTDVKPQTPAVANQGIPDNPNANCPSVTDLAALGGTITSGYKTGGNQNTYYCFTNSTVGKKGAVTPVTLKDVTLGPGIYVFQTGVTVSGAVKVGNGSGTQTTTGQGATIVVTGQGAFDSSTASTFSVYAPVDGVYNAVALYQPASDTQDMTLQFGSSGSDFIGAVYAPRAAVSLHDQGGSVNATNLIVGDIYVNGTINLTNYSTLNPITTPFKQITLVE
jgi:Flp pilus assembly protein TadG